MPAFHIRVLFRVLVVLRLIQLPANVPRKAVKDGSSTWVLATLVGDLGEVPGSWFQPGPNPAIVTI